MRITTMHDGRVVLHQADCRDALRSLADNSIDSVVTDPPYALVSIQKRFGKPGSAPAKDVYGRGAAGFMGKQWDTGEVAFSEEFWAEVLRVLKPGGHVVAFSGTRTYHRMAVAIEDAGFEIRDQLGWVYGSGFPKSHDVSKGIDKLDATAERRRRNLSFTAWLRSTGITAAKINEATDSFMGSHYLTDREQAAVPTEEMFALLRPLLPTPPDFVEQLVAERTVESENFKAREVVGSSDKPRPTFTTGNIGGTAVANEFNITAAATDEARQWQGWGTALKPAWEPICLARKPLVGTVAENVLEHGTGAINIDGSRVPGGNEHALGRWPANIVHDGSDEVLAAFPDTKSGSRKAGEYGLIGYHGADAAPMPAIDGDSGSAARFFYCAKASRADRDAGLDHLPKMAGGMVSNTSGQHITRRDEGYEPTPRANTHPTVKPTTLMQWLCRLVTPPGGTILDPFMGSGSTGKAAVLEGFQFVGCEREDEYMPIATARIAWAIGAVSANDDKEKRPAVAQQQPAVPANDNLPADLFSGAAA
ncbi:DNA methyltransferase [Sinorhizobium meliloti]|uniref:DNA methyltransferase n=1 Tax=Rhizobium meliloti TaxID=382 RepID=UPI000428F250|nr:DNA methyltransferase [Sinorhizobium meliloti]